MAYQPATKFGNASNETKYGDPLVANDGNGDLRDPIEYLRTWNAPNFVTPEELTLLIAHSAALDIQRGELAYPPDVEQTIKLATSFYDTYLSDIDTDRVEVIDRYATYAGRIARSC